MNWNDATLFDCRDGSELHHTEPVEAIEELLDMAYEEGTTLGQTVAACSPVTVNGYRPKTISPRFGEAAIDNMLEDFIENYWCEEYGNCDHQPWGKDFNRIRGRFYALMEECLQSAVTWQCEKVGTREYSNDEVMEIARDWWGE